MSDGISLKKACDFLIDRVPPRFSLHFNPSHGVAMKVGVVAASSLVLVGFSISYLAFPQLTFVAFIIGGALHSYTRHVVKTHAQIFWTVTIVTKLVLAFFSVPSITYISLIFPFFIGSFMAFHALENKTGEKSYFTAPFPKSDLENQVSELSKIVEKQSSQIQSLTEIVRSCLTNSEDDDPEMKLSDVRG